MSSPIEPHSDMRMMAGTLWQMYVAMTQAGFNPAQAMAIVLASVQSAGQRGAE